MSMDIWWKAWLMSSWWATLRSRVFSTRKKLLYPISIQKRVDKPKIKVPIFIINGIFTLNNRIIHNITIYANMDSFSGKSPILPIVPLSFFENSSVYYSKIEFQLYLYLWLYYLWFTCLNNLNLYYGFKSKLNHQCIEFWLIYYGYLEIWFH